MITSTGSNSSVFFSFFAEVTVSYHPLQYGIISTHMQIAANLKLDFLAGQLWDKVPRMVKSERYLRCELNVITVFLMKANGDFAVDGWFSILVAGQPNTFQGIYASMDLGQHCSEVVLDSCYRQRHQWRHRWLGHCWLYLIRESQMCARQPR